MPLAYFIGDVIDIELINARYKWIQLPKTFFFCLWLDSLPESSSSGWGFSFVSGESWYRRESVK